MATILKERDNLLHQLHSIENKAANAFATIAESEIAAIDDEEDEQADLQVESAVVKQMHELKKKIG